MKKTKQILIAFPEYYLLILTILAGYSFPFYFNPIFLGLAIIPFLQIIIKSKISGLIIAGLFVLINLYMLGALISEFKEFSEFNLEAKQLLVGGLCLWIFNMFISGVMVYKYTRPLNENKSSLNVFSN